MAVNFFTSGLDLLGGDPTSWETDTYMGLLLQGSGYVFDPTHTVVSNLAPGSNEASAAGYARDTITTPARVDSPSPAGIFYTADNLDFGSMATGETLTSMVLYRFVTVDADSPLIAQFTFNGIDSAALSPFITNWSPSGVFFLAAA